jgi:OPT family oligopeptide transporter
MPVLNTVMLFNSTGNRLNVLSMLDQSNFDLNEVEYQKHAPILLSTYFALSYAGAFIAISAAFSHVLIWHSGDIMKRFKAASRHLHDSAEDIHSKLMKKYPEVPDRWYLYFLMVLALVQFIVTSFSAFRMSFTNTLLCLAIASLSVLPIGIITAVSGQRLGVNVLTEFIIGLISPGKTVEVMAFKSLGTNSVIQAITLVSDLKLGHYMKINPYHMLFAQIYGSLIGAVTNVIATFWAMDSLRNLLGTGEWRATNYNLFYNAGGFILT